MALTHAQLFDGLTSLRGYRPAEDTLLAALKPGFLIEWELDAATGTRYFAIISSVHISPLQDSNGRIVQIVCSCKRYILPGQIVAIHAALPGDLGSFRARDT
jgi:hypothetical protein